MENKASFIPKKTFSAPVYKKRGLGLVAGLAFVIFLISLSLWGALLVYKKYLNDQIKEKSASLEQFKSAFEPSLIEELVELSEKIKVAKLLLQNHQAPSSIFVFLQENTLKDVRFKDFDYSLSSAGASVSMSGMAKGYSALAVQADIFEKSSSVNEVMFSGFKLDKDGQVNFKVDIVFSPALIAYSLE